MTLHQPQLLIAVDCGTSSIAEIADLNQRGVDVIVLDHHEPKSALPDCVAVVNPKISDECALSISLQCRDCLQALPRAAQDAAAGRASI